MGLAQPTETIEKKQQEHKDTLRQLKASTKSIDALRDLAPSGLQTDIVDKLDELQQRIELLEEQVH